jgi:hypothetical protein
MTEDSLNTSARDLIAVAKGKPPHIRDAVADICRNLRALADAPDSVPLRDHIKNQIDQLAAALSRS